MEDKNKSNISWWQPGLRLFLKLSGWIGGPAIAGVIIGKYLDQKFHTEPWLLLTTASVAFVFSIVKIVKIGMREMDKINPKSQIPKSK
jgi:F0F1-type ATP synthase assembly protein I